MEKEVQTQLILVLSECTVGSDGLKMETKRVQTLKQRWSPKLLSDENKISMDKIKTVKGGHDPLLCIITSVKQNKWVFPKKASSLVSKNLMVSGDFC